MPEAYRVEGSKETNSKLAPWKLGRLSFCIQLGNEAVCSKCRPKIRTLLSTNAECIR
jgi:hypothetical protein